MTIVLADGDTAGAAEAVAGVIELYDKALIMGQQTAGRAVEYSDLKLPSGKVLRVAVGEAVLPEGRPLFPGGLKPDVPVEMAAVDKREIFQSSREKGMTPFVVQDRAPPFERSGAHFGKEPGAGGDGSRAKARPQSRKAGDSRSCLQRALDLVTSIGIFQKK